MVIRMVRMMADGPIILDPNPKKELAGKFFLLTGIVKKRQGGGQIRRISLEPMAPKRTCDCFRAEMRRLKTWQIHGFTTQATFETPRAHPKAARIGSQTFSPYSDWLEALWASKVPRDTMKCLIHVLHGTQNGPTSRQTFDRLEVSSVCHWVDFVRLGACQYVVLLCIWATWGSKVIKTMHEKQQTNGRLRLPQTFAEFVESLLAVCAILKALVLVWKPSPWILIPPKLANGR